MTDRDYQHSRILDVHRWSEDQEANLFVDDVYDTFLNRQEPQNTRIKKKPLKDILLDPYVAWLNDPDKLIILQKACQETDNEMRWLLASYQRHWDATQ